MRQQKKRRFFMTTCQGCDWKSEGVVNQCASCKATDELLARSGRPRTIERDSHASRRTK